MPKSKKEKEMEMKLDAIVSAIKDIKLNNKGIRYTAKLYNIQKSSLSRYIQSINAAMPDIKNVPDNDIKDFFRKSTTPSGPKVIVFVFSLLLVFFI